MNSDYSHKSLHNSASSHAKWVIRNDYESKLKDRIAKLQLSMHNDSSLSPSKKQSRRSSNKREKEEALARLTGNYNHDRKICSSHEHSEIKVPLFSKKVSVQKSEKSTIRKSIKANSDKGEVLNDNDKKTFRDQAVGSGAAVSSDNESIQEVNVEEVAKEVRDAACDPIWFPSVA